MVELWLINAELVTTSGKIVDGRFETLRLPGNLPGLVIAAGELAAVFEI
ncbi:MAG: hypothetical protein ABFD54_01335 [Armatimonadota bacterium]